MSDLTTQYQYNDADRQALTVSESRARAAVKESETNASTSTTTDQGLVQRVAYLERELKRVNDRLRLAEEAIVRLRR
jgi:hypothetical protein